MSTKMKGLLKGLRYISQIFDEEKEQEMQIGLPTDVKHVAHIGWEGPAVDSPSWMKEFNSTSTGISAPLALPGDSKDNPDIQWVSEDSKRGQRTKSSQAKDLPEVPKSSKPRKSATDNNSNDHSPKKRDPSGKPRQSRRKEAKDSSDSSVKSNSSSQQPQESNGPTPDIPRKSHRKKSKELVINVGGDSSDRPSQQPQESSGPAPDVPRKSHRKKSKEFVNEGGSRRSRNRATTSNGTDTSTDDTASVIEKPTTVPIVDDEKRESRVTFKE